MDSRSRLGCWLWTSYGRSDPAAANYSRNPFGNEEPSLIEAGLKRFAAKIPPGYNDGEGRSDQRPERGTGDYRALGVRPELVAEALERTGRRLVLLQQSDFYRLMSQIRPGDEAASESLVEASSLGNYKEVSNESKWTEAAYKRLLNELNEAGNEVQAEVISLAAQSGGFVSRAEIFEYAGYAEDRSLRRFAMPAQRIALMLVEKELLSEDAPMPLEALCEGPGKAVGYRVPPEFIGYENRSAKQLTWIRAAAAVAASAPERCSSPGGPYSGRLPDLTS